jgi:hypothetical protein
MKHQVIVTLILFFALMGTAAAANATSTAELAISNVQVSPGVLMLGDTGTITVGLTNTGSNDVGIHTVQLLSGDIDVVNQNQYNSAIVLGPGNTMNFTFTIKADEPDGIYYPRFYVDITSFGAGLGSSFGYHIPVHIESTGISASVINVPDTFAAGQKKQVTLSVGNPRDTAVSGVVVVPSGDGIRTTQSSVFIGQLQPNQYYSNVTFSVTPTKETNLTFTVNYRNGINPHTTAVTLPVTFGQDKLQAQPILNDIVVTNAGDSYTVTGDATNAGLNQAYNVIVTAGFPATPVNPNPKYDVGSLQADDFASFEITFTVNAQVQTVPLIVQYKDSDGNVYTETFDISLSSRTLSQSSGQGQGSAQAGSSRGAGPFGGFGGGLGKVPFVPIIAGIIIIIAGIIAWRRGILAQLYAKLQERIRRNR